MPISGTDIIPAGKYISIYDNAGNPKVLQRPLNKCLLAFDGDDAYWIDGSDALPLVLPTIKESNGQMTHILGLLSNGRVFKYVATNDAKRILVSQAGIISWDVDTTIGIPTTGFGILSRGVYTPGPGVVPPGPTFFNNQGLVYLDTTGAIGGIANGANGQQLTIVNGVPIWASSSSGSVGGGAASVGLSGVVASNTSTGVVNVRVPSITVTNSSGQEVKLTSVNVSADLGAADGVGGLDIGAENASTWYYLYVVSDGLGTVGAVISQSSTAPDTTNLGANTYSALASVFRNDAGSNIVPYVQRGRDFYLHQIEVAHHAAVTTNYASVALNVALNTVVPPSVKTISGQVGGSGSAPLETVNIRTMVATDNLGTATQAVAYIETPPSTIVDGFAVTFGNFYRIPVADPNSPAIFWKSTAPGTKRRVVINGFSI